MLVLANVGTVAIKQRAKRERHFEEKKIQYFSFIHFILFLLNTYILFIFKYVFFLNNQIFALGC